MLGRAWKLPGFSGSICQLPTTVEAPTLGSNIRARGTALRVVPGVNGSRDLYLGGRFIQRFGWLHYHKYRPRPPKSKFSIGTERLGLGMQEFVARVSVLNVCMYARTPWHLVFGFGPHVRAEPSSGGCKIEISRYPTHKRSFLKGANIRNLQNPFLKTPLRDDI